MNVIHVSFPLIFIKHVRTLAEISTQQHHHPNIHKEIFILIKNEAKMNTNQFSKPLICWVERQTFLQTFPIQGRICIDPHANNFPIFILAF